MENEAKKGEKQVDEEPTPSLEEVVRKMLNTPPKPKKGSPRKDNSPAPRNGGEAPDGADG
jgi:hypothetical protein